MLGPPRENFAHMELECSICDGKENRGEHYLIKVVLKCLIRDSAKPYHQAGANVRELHESEGDF